MSRWIKSLGVLLVIAVCACLVGGCGFAQKTAPHMGFGNLDVEAQITRADIVVLDRVEGSSTLTSVLFGVVNIIDGDKWQVLGIKFFKDKYTYWKGTGGWWAECADRAYYKALEAAPDADVIFQKSMDHENGGIPFLWTTKAVTVRGKAVKLRSDQ